MEKSIPVSESSGLAPNINSSPNKNKLNNQIIVSNEEILSTPQNSTQEQKHDAKTSNFLLMVMEYYLRHNLSWAALEDLLFLINSIVGSNILPSSKYLFQNCFNSNESPNYHYYCENCESYLGNNKNTEIINTFCDNCKKLNISSKCKFFVTLPLEPQLKYVVQNNSDKIHFKLECMDSNIHSVYNGNLYNASKIDCSKDKLISLTINTDGVNVFKSAKHASFWPLQMILNELDVKSRFKTKNIVVTGFWFGSEPIMELFLKPLIDELNSLSKGMALQIKDDIVQIFILPLIFSVDTVAKDLIQRKKQFNGYFGCSYCLHPGKLVKISAKTKQVRYTNINNVELRNHSNALRHMKEAFLTDSVVNGFKGLCPLAALSNFNIIDGFSIDYMHCVLLGVVRKLLNLWFSPTNHSESFYVGREKTMTQINARLLNIKPPKHITRRPRVINERHYWKANEFKNFLLFYGVSCLYDILNKDFLNHFVLLSEAIFLLLQESVTNSDLELANQKLTKFLLNFQNLYGEKNMNYNIHLLSHISNCVRNCGPLWAHSNFCFENNNGVLLKYVKGTTDVLKQIVSKYMFKQLTEKIIQLGDEQIINFHNKLHNKKFTKNYSQTNSICLLGKAQTKKFSKAETQILFKNNLHENVFVYHRAILEDKIYHTAEYDSNISSNDSTIQLIDKSYGTVNLFIKHELSVYILVNLEYEIDDSIILTIHSVSLRKIPNNLKLITANDIKQKCILVDTKENLSVTLFPNMFEID